MALADIPRITEIEKLAYTTPWPSSAYRKELQDNRYAHYIVVRDKRLAIASQQLVEHHDTPRRSFPLSLLPTRPAPASSADLASIIGFAGLWQMLDEAHVTTIAVHPGHRGRGIGELMLSSLISIAYTIGTSNVTLEVRVSNSVAQNLYRKYGFKEAGVRRRYYSDNHEDALIMWTEDIHSTVYKQHFAELRAALDARLEAEQ
jgi:ribosomal-protein-alanine N-acetyltransferase